MILSYEDKFLTFLHPSGNHVRRSVYGNADSNTRFMSFCDNMLYCLDNLRMVQLPKQAHRCKQIHRPEHNHIDTWHCKDFVSGPDGIDMFYL